MGAGKVKVLIVLKRQSRPFREEKLWWRKKDVDGRPIDLPASIKVNKRYWPYEGPDTPPSLALRCLTRLNTSLEEHTGVYSLYYGKKNLDVELTVRDGHCSARFAKDTIDTACQCK